MTWLLLWLMIDASTMVPETWEEAYRAVALLLDKGQYAAAAEQYHELAKSAEQSGDKFATGFALYGAAYSLQEQNRLDEAFPLYQRTLAIARNGGRDLLVLRLRAVNGLTTLQLTAGWYGAAERTLREIGAISQLNQFPAEDALYRNNLGTLQLQRGRLVEAERTLREGLSMVEARLGTTNRYAGGLLNSLGCLASTRGRPSDAVAYFERSLDVSSALFGPDHPAAARARLNLSEARFELGDARGSEEAAARALAAFEQYLGPAHPLTGRALIRRAAALRKLKRTAEAKPLEKRGRAILMADKKQRAVSPVVDISALR